MKATAISNVMNPLLENERVKVYEVRFKPGVATEMHSHADYVVYALGDLKLKETTGDGLAGELVLKAGQVSFEKATSHRIENVGKGEAWALVIELK